MPVEYKITFETFADAEAAMAALEEASMDGEIENAFEIQIVGRSGVGDEG